MDLITGLLKPRRQPHDAILVIVDRLTKMAHYIPTHESVTLEGMPRLYFDNMFQLHGLPDSLVSGRGTLFTSGFSRSLCKWGSGLPKSRLCFLTSKKHKQDYKQRVTTTLGSGAITTVTSVAIILLRASLAS